MRPQTKERKEARQLRIHFQVGVIDKKIYKEGEGKKRKQGKKT